MKKIILVIIPIIIVIALGTALFNPETLKEPKPAQTPDIAEQSVQTVGVLLPITGELSTHGVESVTTTRLAVSDFNDYLEEQDASWRLDIVVEDTIASPVLALEKVAALHAKNIKVAVGPMSSAEITAIRGYTDNNGLVLISPSSSAPALAIPNDSIFRLSPDDTKQGPALANILVASGIEVLVPVWRGDPWGDGLTDATVSSFKSMGGIVDEGIRYNPDTPEFSASTSLLADKVTKHVDEYGAENVGVMIQGFSEVLQFMQSSSHHEILDDVKWFSGDANTKEQTLVEDPIGKEFTNSILFTTTEVGLHDNPIHKSVQDRTNEELGHIPNSYAFASYDAVFLAGLAIQESMKTGVKISDAIPSIAAEYSGAIGKTTLNDAGDLAQADYAIWGIRDGEWKKIGNYSHIDGSVTFN